MSVLIKGMEMPENCYYCALGIYEYPCGFTNQEHLCEDGRPPDCPLVEVPTPHGRLIDADALLESIKEARKKDPEIEDVYIDDYFMVAEWVVSAPTIIGAEECE